MRPDLLPSESLLEVPCSDKSSRRELDTASSASSDSLSPGHASGTLVLKSHIPLPRLATEVIHPLVGAAAERFQVDFNISGRQQVEISVAWRNIIHTIYRTQDFTSPTFRTRWDFLDVQGRAIRFSISRDRGRSWRHKFRRGIQWQPIFWLICRPDSEETRLVLPECLQGLPAIKLVEKEKRVEYAIL